MQAVIGWVVWFLSVVGVFKGTLWQITLISPRQGQVISQVPQDKISVNGSFIRKGNGTPPLTGSVSCNGVSGIINSGNRTWQVHGVLLKDGRNSIFCEYKERKFASRVQIQVEYEAEEAKPPVAAFTASTSNGPAPLTVGFDASNSMDPDGGNIASFEWTFGDGTTLSTASPIISHTFSSVGTFKVQLQVRDDEGILSDPVSKEIETFQANLPPLAHIAANPLEGFAPLKVHFDAAASADADGTISRYEWSFPGGVKVEGQSVDHEFNQAGEHTVTLTVWDDKNVSDTESIQIQVLIDQAGPQIAVTPTSGATIITTTPSLIFTYSDQESRVDLSSAKVSVDGIDLTARLSVSDTEAILAFSSDFPLQNGDHEIIFEVKDTHGNTSRLEADYTVDDGSRPQQSGIAGLVVLPDDSPLKDVTVTITSGPVGEVGLSAVTDEEGRFLLPFTAGGSYVLSYHLEGYTASVKTVNAIAGIDISSEKAILKQVDANISPVTAATGGSAINSTGTVSIQFPAGSLAQDSNIVLTEAKAGIELPYPLPELSDFTYAVEHTPHGLTFNEPVLLEMKNDLGLPPNSEIPLGITDHSLGLWMDSGRVAKVSADGTKISYLLDHFSSSDANTGQIPQDGAVTPDPDGDGSQAAAGPVCLSCPCPTEPGSIIKGSNCSLGTTVGLPPVIRNGRNFALNFRYNSDTVMPLIGITTTNQQDHLEVSAALSLISHTRVAGLAKKVEYAGNSNIKPSVIKDILPAVDPRGEVIKTGSYAVEHEIAALYEGEYATAPYFGGPAIESLGVPGRQPTLLKEKLETRVGIQNHTNSPFGAGWSLEGFERLYEGPDGAILWENGKGVAQTFLPLGSGSNQKSLTTLDYEVSDVLVYQGFLWVSSCSGNVVQQMTLEGHVHKNWPMDCPTRLTPSRRGGILVVVGNGNRIVRLTVQGEQKLTYSKSFGEPPISDIAEDGALAVHYISGRDVKTVSPRDGSIFHYLGDHGLIKTSFGDLTDIQVDSFDNLMLVDKAQGKVFKVFPKTREVRTILGDEEQAETLKKSFSPVRLVRDQKLKRFFVLEESGQMWHWQGPGHERVDPISFEHGAIRTGRQKSKDVVKVLAYSSEVGPIMASRNSIWWRRPSSKDIGDVSYLSPVHHFSTLMKKSNGTFERIDVDKTKTQYSEQGLITATILPDGQTTSYNYLDGKLTQINTPAGDSFVFNYNGSGYLESITDPAGRITNFVINGDGNLVQVEMPDTTVKEYSYDQDHLMTSETDEESRQTQYFYRSGRVIKEVYPGNRERPISPALFVGYSEDTGSPLPRITPESQISQFTSPEGRVKGMELDRFGLVERIYDAEGRSTLIERDVNGMPTTEISVEGRKVFRKYDGLGRIIQEEGPRGLVMTSYDPVTGKVARISERSGTTIMTYNALSQLETVTDKRGFSTSFTYHPNGTLASVTNAKNETTYFETDAAGNVTAVVDQLGNRTQYTLDDSGNMIEVIDPKGQKTTMTRDSKGRVLTVTTPLGGTTTFVYTPTGKLASLTDARGKTTTWTFNEQDLVASETNPLGLTELYSYDRDGLLIEKKLRSGEVIRYEYDLNKRLIKISSPNDMILWSYDKDGLPLHVEDNDSSVSWSYDGYGRPVKEFQSTSSDPIRFFYNQEGFLIRRTLGSQISESLGYNEDGALEGMTYQHYGVSRSINFERDELNRNVLTKFYPGGTVLRSFDGLGRLMSLETKTRSEATVGSFNFTYDPNSNITDIEQFIDGIITPKAYDYDSENRLVKAEHGSDVEVWSLDLLGNWSGNGRVFNNANQLIEDQTFFYSYDLRGNMIQKTSKLGSEVTEYEWDFFDRLIEVRMPTKRVIYSYDPTGRRIERVFDDLLNATSKVSRWTYLKEDQWVEKDNQNKVLAVTLNGESIDDVLSLTVKDPNQSTPGIALEPIKDHLGSIYGWTNATSGEAVQKQTYSAYGETTVSNTSLFLSQLGALRGYTGRELDQDTDLYYYRARYYDPQTGRFLSEDPIGFKSGDLNYYRYVFNNPLLYTDPSGHGIGDFIDDVKDFFDDMESWDDYLEGIRKFAQCKIDPSKCGKDPAEEPVDPKDFDPDKEEPQNMCPAR